MSLTPKKNELYQNLRSLMDAVAQSKSAMDLHAERKNDDEDIVFTYRFSISAKCRQQILACKTIEELEKWAQKKMPRKRKVIEISKSEDRHKE